MSRSFIRHEVRDQVLTVTIERPEKRNALSRVVLTELAAAFETHAQDLDLKAAVLRGDAEKSFAAGGDLVELAALRSKQQAADMADHA